ncbi:MAG: hypothetical protein Q8K58_03170 [Acidimicrobiales bacterium]|nr:hypothetical protein [Acidimicrobiales bacterium]
MIAWSTWWMVAPADAQTFTNPAPINLPGPGPGVPGPTPSPLYPSNIVVSGLSGTVTDVNVTLNGMDCSARGNDYAFPEDVDIMLVGPTGATAVIYSDVGGTNVDVPPLQFGPINITLDDQAPNPLPADTQLSAGTYRPTDDDDDLGEQPNSQGVDLFPAPAPAPSANTALSTFNGTAPNGTWSLYVVDDYPGPDNCRIADGWTLDILASAVAPSQPAIATQATNATVGGAIGDTATVTGLVNPVVGAGAGTVTFRLYSDAACANEIFVSSNRPLTLTSASSGTATSETFTPATGGSYFWRAFYSGDANNLPVGGACGAPGETSVFNPGADLSIAKTCDPGPVAPSSIINCTVTVSNAGPGTAQSVVVSDDLPAGVALVGTPAGPGFTCGTGDPFICTMPSLAANATATFTYSVQVHDVAPGSSLTNTATVSSATADPGPRPNTARATTSVVRCTISGAGDILGTAGNDVICGSPGADRIAGLGGDDIIFGLGGNDQITGGDGNDVLLGGDGSDQLVGANGNDRLYGGGGGVDRLSGGPGDDRLSIVDGTSDDFAVGGTHVTGDACHVDPGDATAECESSTVGVP